MKPKEVEIAGQRSFVVSLEEENVGLEEVVVVGYGTQKRRALWGLSPRLTTRRWCAQG
jgi:hypothetical protein